MPKSRKGYSENYLEYVRARVTMSGADAYTEVQIPTPVGRANRLAMLLHQIEFELDHGASYDVVADNDEFIAQLTSVSKTEIVGLHDADCIAKMVQVFKMVTSGMTNLSKTFTYTFIKPVLYAKSSLFFGVDTAGQAVAKVFNVRIGYTIEEVPAEVFIEALVD